TGRGWALKRIITFQKLATWSRDGRSANKAQSSTPVPQNIHRSRFRPNWERFQKLWGNTTWASKKVCKPFASDQTPTPCFIEGFSAPICLWTGLGKPKQCRKKHAPRVWIPILGASF